MPKENGKEPSLTTQDVLELSAHLLINMPEPDGDGVFDDAELETWENEMRFVCSSLSDKVLLFRMLADRVANEAAFVLSQEDALSSRRSILEQKRDRLISRLRDLLYTHEKLTGKPKVETSDHSWVGIRRAVKKVVRIATGCEDGLPDHFVRVKRTADRAALMQCYTDTPDLLPTGVTVEDSHSEAVMWPKKVK
jgi:hypothetical protein